MWARYALVAIVVGGCYQLPTGEADCSIACAMTCPGDLTCSHGLCTEVGNTCGSGSQGPGNVAVAEVGARSTCAISDDQRLWCWGNNDIGQLGVGSSVTIATTPSAVGSAGVAWTALAVGADHACAIHDGVVECWGNGTDGEVNGVSGREIPTPTAVQFGAPPPAAFEQVSAGGQISCALGSGDVWCWGAPDGLGFTPTGGATKLDTASVGGPFTFTAVHSSSQHSCGITDAGGVVCWGHNDDGELGVPASTTPTIAAVPLPADLFAIVVAPGYRRTCAILGTTAGATSGALYCWGYNDDLLIDPAIANQHSLAPEQVGIATTWTAIATDMTVACGVQAGSAVCWGKSANGALGDGVWIDTVATAGVAKPLGAADAVAVSMAPLSGEAHEQACMLHDHQLACWGDNRSGELATGGVTEPGTPVVVPPPTAAKWAHLWSGDYHTCGQDANGALWCWGADYAGQVSGIAKTCAANAPCDLVAATAAPIASMVTNLGELVAGDAYTCARDATSRSIYCWGDPTRTGTRASDASVQRVGPAGAWASVIGGDHATCGLDSAGAASCWGDVKGGSDATPTALPGVGNLSAMSFGYDFECGIDTGANRVCGGYNDQGELGNGSVDAQYVDDPPVTSTERSYQAIATGYRHACALDTTGAIYCWGTNYNLESGQPPAVVVEPDVSPVLASGGDPQTGCTKLAVSPGISCAICGGVPVCWGANDTGQLGDAPVSTPLSATPRDLPVPVPGLTWSEIATGLTRTCALATDGTLACFGYGVHGELGNGATGSPFPVVIAVP